MNSSSHVHQVVLRQSTASERRPTVSLSLTVKSGCEGVGSLLDDVGPWVDEIVIVVVDPPSSVVDFLKSHPVFGNKKYVIVEVSRQSHPHLYAKDALGTFGAGRSLVGEIYADACSGEYFVSDWSGVRNLGLFRCSEEWRLVLDGDDVLANPAYVASVCEAMDGFGSELGYSKYVRSGFDLPVGAAATSLAGRLVKNGSSVRWEGVAKEAIEGSVKTVVIDGSMVVTKTARLDLARERRYCFKALYANARARNWEIPPCDLLHMAKIARFIGMSDFAEAATDAYLATSLYTEERAWAFAIRGEIQEARGDHTGASAWYERSLAEHPGYKSAYRLCRSRFFEGEWQASLNAFESGCQNDSFVHFVDDGAEDGSKALIFAVAALEKLGRIAEAREKGEILRKIFPGNETVARLCAGLG